MELTEKQKMYKEYKDSYTKYTATKKERFKDEEYRDNLHFGGNRRRALERDNHRCIECGMVEHEHVSKWGFGLTVDHIDGKGSGSKVKNNALSNLQTLCLSCHGSKDIKRRKTRTIRKVKQLTLEGKLIKIWKSTMAVERELGIHNNSICRVCNGKNYTAGGFKWEYIEEKQTTKPTAGSEGVE